MPERMKLTLVDVGTGVCNDPPMTYDLARMIRLGRRRKEVEAELKREVVAARAARVTEETIAASAQVSRQTVRNWVRRAAEAAEEEVTNSP